MIPVYRLLLPLLLLALWLAPNDCKSHSALDRLQSRIRNNKAREKKSYRRRPIVPQPKESLLSKARKSWDQVSRSVQIAQRDLKAYFSSDFEALLLKLTEPDDSRPSPDDMNRIIATIETFVRNLDTTDINNPYRVTLHKIWSKMIETDIRTRIKAVYILHTILRYTEPDDAVIFKSLMLKMSKEFSKRSNSKYFDSLHITNIHDDRLNIFLTCYSTYVLKRSRAFTSSFEELGLISKDMRTEDICAQVMRLLPRNIASSESVAIKGP